MPARNWLATLSCRSSSVDGGQRAIDMILDRQHVAGERGRGIARRLLHLGFEPAAHVLRLGGRIERLGLRFLELPFELGDVVVLGHLGSAFSRFPADVLRLVVQCSSSSWVASFMPSISSALSQ